MAGYVMKMSILVSIINCRGQKDFFMEFAKKHMLTATPKFRKVLPN